MESNITTEINGEIVKIEFKNYYDGSKTKVKNNHLFYVKAEYLKVNPDYAKLTSLDLFSKTDIQKFLHNPNGPAVIDVKADNKTYFLDGNLIVEDSEEFKKIKHNEMFNGKMDQILAE